MRVIRGAQKSTGMMSCSPTIVFWANVMNEQTQNNRQKNYFKLFQFSELQPGRGSLYASKNWLHTAKLNKKSGNLQSGHIL